MSDRHESMVRLAAELRVAFDASFATSPAGEAGASEPLLAIRVASRAYAVRLAESAEVARGRVVVPVPGPLPELLGLAGIRGRLLPVYDLGALVGHGLSAGTLPWLVVGRGAPVAFAFEQVDGLHRTRRDDVYRGDRAGCPTELVRLAGEAREILSVPALVEVIRERALVPKGVSSHG